MTPTALTKDGPLVAMDCMGMLEWGLRYIWVEKKKSRRYGLVQNVEKITCNSFSIICDALLICHALLICGPSNLDFKFVTVLLDHKSDKLLDKLK